jgi:5-methylcytosine-specific restriction endonuclease McrBC regulatory subunit McrC
MCNLYTNIPNNEFPDIIKTQMESIKIDKHINKELLEWCKIILNQNYFQHHGGIYAQTNGLAVGSPTLTIFL